MSDGVYWQTGDEPHLREREWKPMLNPEEAKLAMIWKLEQVQAENAKLRELGKELLAMVDASEWETRHAAENQYCPYCANDADSWTDQKEHHPGCKWVELTTRAKEALSQ